MPVEQDLTPITEDTQTEFLSENFISNGKKVVVR